MEETSGAPGKVAQQATKVLLNQGRGAGQVRPMVAFLVLEGSGPPYGLGATALA